MKSQLTLLAVMLCMSSYLSAQIEVAAYSGSSSPTTYTLNNIQAVALDRGPGISAASGATFNSRDWSQDSVFNTTVKQGSYIEWTLSVALGYELQLSSMDIEYDRSKDGPQRLELRSSSDGYTSSIYTDSVVSENGERNKVALNIVLQAGQSVTFRLYGYQANGSSGTFDIENDLSTDSLAGGVNAGIILKGTLTRLNSCNYPTVAASSLTVDRLTDTRLDLSWTRGDGDSVLIVARDLDSLYQDPADGRFYQADSSWASGQHIAAGSYAVYRGQGTSFSLTGLSPDHAYQVNLYEFNGGSCYLKPAQSTSLTTLCSPADKPDSLRLIASNQAVSLSWVNGACSDSALVIASTSPITYQPSGHVSSYLPSATYGSGSNPAVNSYVVYAGSGSAIKVLGLTNGTTYYFKVYNSKLQSWSGGVERSASPQAVVAAGDLLITEFMSNPDSVSDARGEYLELYNTTAFPIQLENFELADAGSNSHTINSPLVIPPHEFLVLATDSMSSVNGGLSADYQWSGFNLSNADDEIFLINPEGDTVDVIIYDNGSWPLAPGAATVFSGSSLDDNNDPAQWVLASKREYGFMGANGDQGSPGSGGVDQIVDQIVFKNGSWIGSPVTSSAHRDGLVLSGENASLSAPASFRKLRLEPGASLDLNGHTLTVGDTLHLLADTSGYAQILGNVSGWVEFERVLNSDRPARWFNISLPIDAALNDLRVEGGGRIVTAADGTAGQVNIYYFNPRQLNANTGEGSWLAVPNRNVRLDTCGFSIYLGAPYFGSLPAKISVTGQLNDGAINRKLASANGGWNFMGNPYPSTLDWDAMVNDNSAYLNSTYYIFKDDSDSAWVGYNSAAGGIPQRSNLMNPLLVGERYIAPGEGFFMKSTMSTNLILNNSQRSVMTNPPQYRQQFYPGLFIVAEAENGSNDYTYIGFRPTATDSIDELLDGRKRMNTGKSDLNLYSKTGSDRYMYNFLSDQFQTKEQDIYLSVARSTNYTLTLLPKNMDPAWGVALQYQQQGQKKIWRMGDQPLALSAAAGISHFKLLINKQQGVGFGEEDNPNLIYWTIESGQLQLFHNNSFGSVISLYSADGRRLRSVEAGANPAVLNINGLASGVYVLQLEEAGEMVYRSKLIR